MKTIFALATVAALTGCATQPSTVYYPKPANPYEWHTVSVTPVQPGTRAVAGDARVEYTTEPVAQMQPRVVYTTEPLPVYVPQPLYAPAPAYYYPPVTIGLDFIFSNRGHRHRGHGYGRRR